MLRLILTRIFLGCLTLFAVTILIFAATEILPGDVASAILGQGATPETLAAFRIELGLNRPAYVRYFEWLFNALQGDLGTALTNKREVLATITPRLINTLFLAGYAAVIAVPIAIFLGIVAAIN
jgi:peptide/nickel transport system permease protein